MPTHGKRACLHLSAQPLLPVLCLLLQVLIVSYETFRIHAERFRGEGSCDLLICDEAHRLKNDQTLTNKARGAALLLVVGLASRVHVDSCRGHTQQQQGAPVGLFECGIVAD